MADTTYWKQTVTKVDSLLKVIHRRTAETSGTPLICIESNPSDAFLLYAHRTYGFDPAYLCSISADRARHEAIIIQTLGPALSEKLGHPIHAEDFTPGLLIGRHGSQQANIPLQNLQFFEPERKCRKKVGETLGYSSQRWCDLTADVTRRAWDQGIAVVQAARHESYHDTSLAISSGLLDICQFQRIANQWQLYMHYKGHEGFLSMPTLYDTQNARLFYGSQSLDVDELTPSLQAYVLSELKVQEKTVKRARAFMRRS